MTGLGLHPGNALQPWIDRFAFEGQDSEDAFVGEAQRILAHEPLQGLDAEGELAAGKRTLCADVTRTQAFEVRGQQIFCPVEDAEVLWAAALDGWLGDAAAAFRDEAGQSHLKSD